VHPDGPTPKGARSDTGDAQAGQRTLEATRSRPARRRLKTSVQLNGGRQLRESREESLRGISAWRLGCWSRPGGTTVPPLPGAGHELKLQLALPAARASAARSPKGCSSRRGPTQDAAKPPLELAGVITLVDAVATRSPISAERNRTPAAHDVMRCRHDQVERIDRAGDSRRPRHYRPLTGAIRSPARTRHWRNPPRTTPPTEIGDFVPKKQPRKPAVAARRPELRPRHRYRGSSLLAALSSTRRCARARTRSWNRRAPARAPGDGAADVAHQSALDPVDASRV